jgi:AraC-like DNA-binding protein
MRGARIMAAISLDYAMPDESLRSHLSVFYEFRADVPVFEDIERADLAQVRFMLSGSDGEYRFADGTVQKGPQIQIVGPTTGPTGVRVNGPVHIFGAGLLPAGWGSMLDFEASLLVNRVIDATELFGKGLYHRLEQLRATTTLEEKCAIGTEIAKQLIDRGHSAAFDFARIVDAWLADSPSPDVDTLVAATHLSRRQVERNCKAVYGLPPKMLARKYRALKAAISLAKHEAGTQDLVDHGFYDQSHFIREIKHFTGVTPKVISEDLPTLATLTLKRTELEGLSPLVTKV